VSVLLNYWIIFAALGMVYVKYYRVEQAMLRDNLPRCSATA
jgi:hypothetical protein